MNRTVLVLDADLPPALTIARSLHARGISVDVASHEARPIAGYSRAVDKRHRYPDPLEHEFDFIEWVAERLADPRYDLVIPVTERTVTPLLKHRKGLADERLAMAGSDALAVVLDKSRTVALAEELGIPSPASRLVTSLDEAEAAADALGYPIVIKPVSSVGGRGPQNVQLTVSYAVDPGQLKSRVTHALRYGNALLQERFAGDGVGIELIADRGRIVYPFQHLRQHEVPLTGGGSSLRMSMPIEPALLEASQKLIGALGWHGVGMVEFKRKAATGEFRLMEINGRFWGSLPLAFEAGADFPAMLYELLVEGRVADWPPYRNDITVRNLSRDVYWHELVVRRDAPAGLVTLPTTREVLKDVALVCLPRHRFDVQKWWDPLPGLVDVGRIFRNYGKRLGNIVAERRNLREARRAWTGGSVAAALKGADNVLFLCYGNINRSAVAERYARARLPADVTVVSAGFHPEEGRPADPVMIDVAAARQIDMQGWSSQRVTPAMIEHAAAIFVMEVAHRKRLLEAFPEAAGKVFLLGMGADGVEIADPYGQAREVYARSLDQVMRGIDAIARLTGTA